MIFWIDAQLSPYLAPWLSSEFDVEATPIRELGLRGAKGRDIFLAAREAGAVVLTKDKDFVRLLEQLGPPPQILWLMIGNTSNTRLKESCRKVSRLFRACLSAVSRWSRSQNYLEPGARQPQ